MFLNVFLLVLEMYRVGRPSSLSLTQDALR